MAHRMFLFGEAEKGEFCTPLVCRSLPQLAETLGHPPDESQGIHYGVQALLFERELIFYRVKEEGYSTQDYLKGLRILENKEAFPYLSAICMPGVGDAQIIELSTIVCSLHKSLLILSEKDLYDFLTSNI